MRWFVVALIVGIAAGFVIAYEIAIRHPRDAEWGRDYPENTR